MALGQLSVLHAEAWVDAAPFRARLRDLVAESGLPWRVVGLALGVPAGVVRSLLFGREGRAIARIRSLDADRIMTGSVGQLRRLNQLPTDPTRLKLAVSLLSTELADQDLCDRLAISPDSLRQIRSGRTWATQLTGLRAVALCDELGIDLDEWTEQLSEQLQAA